MIKDQMTPIERMAAYNKGQQIDRLPCVPIVGNTAARVINARISELRGNGKLIAKAHVAAYKLFGYDVIRVFTDLYVQAEAMGAKIHYPYDQTAYLEVPAIDDISEIDSLEPADPYKDGNLPHHIEAMKIVAEEVGNEVTVTGPVTCPFTNASFLIGAENLVRLTLKDPDKVHKLCEISLETNLRYAKAIIDAGCTPSLTDAMSSNTVISPKQFKEFSYPYLKRLIDYIHSRGKSVTLHICGKTNKIWELMAEAGADCISIDNDANLLEAKQKVGHKVRLMGNIKPSETMLQGTVSDVKKAVFECIRQAYDSPKGYIVASGCSLPTETPFRNIHAMMDAVREIGYPPNEDVFNYMIYKGHFPSQYDSYCSDYI
ncbi:uroporphyrinogen decarboxylase [Clostridium sp. Bc-iso-3]|nr:uroporphyrinogen decarboxylase [Clostridium sp. Bc-iso-3]